MTELLASITALGIIASIAAAVATAPLQTVVVPLMVALVSAGPGYVAIRKERSSNSDRMDRFEAKLDRHIEAHSWSRSADA